MSAENGMRKRIFRSTWDYKVYGINIPDSTSSPYEIIDSKEAILVNFNVSLESNKPKPEQPMIEINRTGIKDRENGNVIGNVSPITTTRVADFMSVISKTI